MRLSVVVTIVEAHDALMRCLGALAAQHDPPELEVIVPWDDSVPGVAAMAARFPGFQFLDLGTVATARPKHRAAGQHELFDRRRAAGLAAATGDVIAILEDRGVPRLDWARTMLALHEQLPHAVIGGAIENGRDSLLHWAVYFCDFGRYQRPFSAGPRPYVSDVNIGYKRRALEETAELWRGRYHETTVHWALQRAGQTLYLTPDLVVDQFRGALQLKSLTAERFAWGRLFAFTRAREMTRPKRAALAALAPLLPALLVARHARLQIAKGVNLRRFLRVLPLVVVLLVAWSFGEALGYMTAEP
jgi:GT2 family glycosyltransferase